MHPPMKFRVVHLDKTMNDKFKFKFKFKFN